jgi:diketogulonate reductase-like aldo/keto reductase
MLLPLAAERGIATISNRPLEGGTLLRRLARRAVPQWARDCGATTWPALLLKYLLAEPALTCVIPATQDPGHARELFAAGAGRLPTPEERRRMIAAIAAA